MSDSLSQDQTLEQLERKIWGEPPIRSHLVTECHRLRKVPLKDFNIENLRIMLGQNIGTEYLLPIAIEKLQKNVLVAGDHYDGDLLFAVLAIEPPYWQSHPDQWKTVRTLVESNRSIIDAENDLVYEQRQFDDAWNFFLKGAE